MIAANRQYPIISLFLGGKSKKEALRNMLSENSPKRLHCGVAVSLHCDLLSMRSPTPMLFADSDPLASPVVGQERMPRGARELAFNGHVSTTDVHYIIYSRLLVPFVDIVCVFADDFPSLDHVVDFLAECSARTLPSRPDPVRPRLMIVVNANSEGTKESGNEKQWPQQLDPGVLSRAFSAISIVHAGSSVGRLKRLMTAQAEAMHRLRRNHDFLFTATHMAFLFQAAVNHLARSFDEPFDFVSSSRTDGGVPLAVRDRLSLYRGLCRTEGLPDEVIAQSVASALIMDYYRPDMPLLDPQLVFRTFYRAYIAWMPRELDLTEGGWEDLVEASMIEQFGQLKNTGKSSVELRRGLMASQSDQFRRVKSNHLCLYCLFRPAQHPAACGHSLCDLCPQLFGTPAADREFYFTVTPCGHCLSPDPLVIDLLPPTMSPTVVAIDGGGVRAVIPLEFLILVQEHLGKDARLADFVDLGVGTSSGKA
ncbi:hypothetical protein Plec18167_006157 [Paecilomyces lecythidis]|uniref:RING-type domain-containing protein n=1 Tax=Paecilomyces lecythidis TaxID=3004212 RepID=A0ABR3XCG2_9EURO